MCMYTSESVHDGNSVSECRISKDFKWTVVANDKLTK